jgi:serine/threonine protein phosphatase PrpC
MPIETGQHIIGYRKVCQDAAGVFERARSTVLVVADGAGGIEDGEIASKSVVDAVRSACREATAQVDWVQVLRQADNAIASGQSTACIVELTDTALRGASVGDSRVGTLVGDDLEFPSDGQQRKPLLGSGEAVPKPFSMPWPGSPVIVGSDGFWNYVRHDRLLAELRFIDFPVLAKTLAEMVRLPSGGLADDVAVVCAHRRRLTPAKRRIDLLAGEA